jgi:hypothetical protein
MLREGQEMLNIDTAIAAFGLDRNQNYEITRSQVIVQKYQFLIGTTELMIDQIMLN